MVAIALVGMPADESAEAAEAGDFNPGYIISDQNFYNANAMSESEIQGFLSSKVGACQNSQCLSVGIFPTTSKDASYSDSTRNLRCGAYPGGANESAARILFKVQQACGISAKVLLVTLQKEQGLITNTAPSDGRLKIAMGFACPDTAPCDTQFYGFFNQVYQAAKQLNTYKASQFGMQPGLRSILWNPNGACGSTVVDVRNYATAALYNYTPYQPNAAAMANLYSSGDGCSSYGNRNFWRDYSDWFGSPTGGSLSPVGNFEVASAAADTATFRGWTFDPESPNPIDVHLYIDGQWGGSYSASVPRYDVAVAHPSYGPNHGFSITTNIGDDVSSFVACVYAINVGIGENMSLGCRLVTMPTGSPHGNLESVTRDGQTVAVKGWALDPDNSLPVAVKVHVNGTETASQTADIVRNDVANAYPGYGNQRGFHTTVNIPVGTSDVCVISVNTGGGADSTIGCRTVSSASGSPRGSLDSATVTGPGAATIRGWALDPDMSSSIDVHVYVNGSWGGALLAGEARADVGAAYPGYGPSHGYALDLAVPAGRSQICAYGINVRGGSNALIGCKTVDSPSGSSFGNYESIAATETGVQVYGWTIDPDTTAPIGVHVYIDGGWGGAFTADTPRSDVGAAYPVYGALHGISLALPMSLGTHSVCVYAIDVGVGENVALGCKSISR